MRRLYRSRSEKIIGGVAGGFANYLDIDPVIVRILFVALTLLWGASLLLYIIMWIIIPFDPLEKPWEQESVEEQSHKEINHERRVKHKSLAGIILVLIGTLLLFDNFVTIIEFEIIFPIIMIAAGGYIIYNSIKEPKKEACNEGS